MKTRLCAIAALAVLSTGALTACGTSAPPPKELADEVIDTLEVDGKPVSDEIKACMHAKVDDFQLTGEQAQGFENFEDVAEQAAEGDSRALEIMQQFEDSLAECNDTTAG